MVTADGEVPFTRPVAGIDPTAAEHLATKAYVDSSGGGVTAHADLTGLSADDHTHYSKADGTRAFTGVVVGVDPTLSTHLATKGYTDYADGVVMSTVAAAAAATYQPLNVVLSNLSSWSTSVVGHMLYFGTTIGGLGSFATTSYGRGLLNSADAAAMRTAIGTVIGTDVQAYSAKLDAISALTWANDKGVYLTGTSTLATFDLTSFGRTLIGSASAVVANDAITTKGADIASSGTTNLASATGQFVHVTGTTTITAFGTAAAGVERIVRFAGALTLTHNATSLILPGAASITTAANDIACFVSEGSGNWRCTSYHRASSTPFHAPDWHPYSAQLEDFDLNVIQSGNPGIYGTDGGGTSALVSSAGASDDDILVVDSTVGAGASFKTLIELLNSAKVPRRTWQENGYPVRTVGASSTTEETVVSQSIGGSSDTAECWELRFWGDFIQNAGVSNTSRMRIKLGSTTVWDKANSFGTSSGRRVLVGRILVSQGTTTSEQRITGEILLSQPLNATSGYGDYGAFAACHGGIVAGDATEALSAAKTLSVTHQWDVNNANSYLRVYKAELIYHP